MCPTEDRAHVDQVLAVVTDAVADGRLAFHPKDFYKSHKVQVEESKPYIVQYGSERLPKYMQVGHDWKVETWRGLWPPKQPPSTWHGSRQWHVGVLCVAAHAPWVQTDRV